jgi:hypothetical protein
MPSWLSLSSVGRQYRAAQPVSAAPPGKGSARAAQVMPQKRRCAVSSVQRLKSDLQFFRPEERAVLSGPACSATSICALGSGEVSLEDRPHARILDKSFWLPESQCLTRGELLAGGFVDDLGQARTLHRVHTTRNESFVDAGIRREHHDSTFIHCILPRINGHDWHHNSPFGLSKAPMNTRTSTNDLKPSLFQSEFRLPHNTTFPNIIAVLGRNLIVFYPFRPACLA